MAPKILILNGPNLNLLGTRQPELYGSDTLDDVQADCTKLAGDKVALEFKQSNHEGQLVDWIQQARENTQAIIINAGAYTHTSVAIMDALFTFEGPVIELHVSNVFRRESFRHHSYISNRADGVMAGFGVEGYQLSLRRASSLLGVSL